mmetsp:Transcript_28486/g.71572  ORF Transcript_28486/g.71572 Transcript_28486/m.71572 type:complete len:489 (-) Transcript_28486:307-1773(-)
MLASPPLVASPDSGSSAQPAPPTTITFALPVSVNEGRDDVMLSAVHKIGDVSLQLQVKPAEMAVLAGASSRDSIMLHCEWPWFEAVSQLVSSKAFHARQVKFNVDVTVQHPTLPGQSVHRTMKFAESLSSHTCSQGVAVKLGDLRNWLGSCEHLLIIVNVRGDFNIFERAGVAPVNDTVLSRMWSDMRFADFHIAAKGQEIRCHRSVLAAASPVFEAMVESDMQEGSQAFASIDEMPEDIRAMLEFVYTERLPCGLDCLNILRILRIADCYQLPKLFQVCKGLILPLVTSDNIAEVIDCLALLEFIPDCKVMSGLVFHSIQRDFQLVATIAKHLVLARQEIAATPDASWSCNKDKTSKLTSSVGVQCERVDDQDARCRHWQATQHEPSISGQAQGACSSNGLATASLGSAPPDPPCSTADVDSRTLSRQVLLHMRDNVSRKDLGIVLRPRSASGPRRRTRRGTHGQNGYGHVQVQEYAPSFCTYDSWR